MNDAIRTLNSSQRKKVEARGAELLAEEMTLKELRRARKLTQVRVAKALGITQDSVSRLEKRSDVLLSTLHKSVHVMGGHLSLVVEFLTVHRYCWPALPKPGRKPSQPGASTPAPECCWHPKPAQTLFAHR